MPKLTIDIPETLAALLQTCPLPLPVDDYCRRALEDAALQERERRACLEALLGQLAEGMNRVLPSSREDTELFTVPETAKLLKLSPETVRKLIREGKLSAANVGRKKLVSWRTISRVITHVPEDDTDLSGVLASIRRSRSLSR